jgi:hypothetical protein
VQGKFITCQRRTGAPRFLAFVPHTRDTKPYICCGFNNSLNLGRRIFMKYTRFLFLFLIGLAAQSAWAQKITFKDENLKQALLDGGYDRNKDGEIEVSEIDTVTKLGIAKKKIKSLDDLVWFKGLRLLYANGNEIQNLDVFFNNSVIETIYIGKNPLDKKLILRNVKNLKRFYAFADSLEEIDFTGTDNIKLLYLQENRFEKVEFKNLVNLELLQLGGNKTLKIVDVSANQHINSLYLLGTAITQLDVTSTPLLKILYIENNVKLIKSNTQENLKPMQAVTVQERKN